MNADKRNKSLYVLRDIFKKNAINFNDMKNESLLRFPSSTSVIVNKLVT